MSVIHGKFGLCVQPSDNAVREGKTRCFLAEMYRMFVVKMEKGEVTWAIRVKEKCSGCRKFKGLIYISIEPKKRVL